MAIVAHVAHVNVARNKKMKLTKETLKQIIKEELEAVMDEGVFDEPDPTSKRVQQANMRKQFINFVVGTAKEKGISEGQLVDNIIMSEGTGEGVFYDWMTFYKAKGSVMKTYDIPVEEIPLITAEAIAGVMQTYLQEKAEKVGRNAMNYDKIKNWVVRSHSKVRI